MHVGEQHRALRVLQLHMARQDTARGSTALAALQVCGCCQQLAEVAVHLNTAQGWLRPHSG
jgi:hypothetical protein